MRNREYDRLSQSVTTIEVSRENIYADMINRFTKRNVLANQVVIHFTDENAVGDGVSRDAFSAFFESLYGKMDGYFEKIPTAKIPEDELEIVGKIIHHGYIQYGMIPSRLSRSCFKYYLFETISDEELITSFFNFVTPLEAERIKNFTSNDTQSIMDILFEYSIFEIPTTENVMKLVLKAAKMAIIRQPCYYMMSIVRGMGFFWKKLSPPMINSLFESLTPTHERLINCLEPCECNAQDQKITTWFHRYIRSCSSEQLEKLLRFITASSSLPRDTKIKIQFVNQPPKYLRPHAQTCFKILLIPRQYASFTQLYENFNFYMAHSEYWGVHDESYST